MQPFNGPLYVGLDGIYIVFMALVFSSLVLGQSQDFAPSYAKAMHAARRVFSLMDRSSAVDSEGGEKMVRGWEGGEKMVRGWERERGEDGEGLGGRGEDGEGLGEREGRRW